MSKEESKLFSSKEAVARYVGGTGGVYYPLGGGIADGLTKKGISNVLRRIHLRISRKL